MKEFNDSHLNHPPLKHLAIIMDGNGRWAKNRNHNRLWGHIRGSRVAKSVTNYCIEHPSIDTLTLFTFSSENWKRPKTEVDFLFKLLKRYLSQSIQEVFKKNVRISHIGDLSKLPEETAQAFCEIEQKSSKNTGLHLIFALNYGGQQEILEACKKALALSLKPSELTIDCFEGLLDSGGVSKPDLVIRTSGETRISNFMLWSIAYSELYFCQNHWPDFSKEDFDKAVAWYQTKKRRFGGLGAKENSHSNADVSKNNMSFKPTSTLTSPTKDGISL